MAAGDEVTIELCPSTSVVVTPLDCPETETLASQPLLLTEAHIQLEVFQARALEESSDTVFGNRQDFYFRASIDGSPTISSPSQGGRDWVGGEPLYRTGQGVNITGRTEFASYANVEMWDKDVTSSDDLFDVNEAVGKSGLEMVFDACTLRWTGHAQSTGCGGVAGGAGPGRSWMCPGTDGAFDERGDLQIKLSTASGRPLLPNDIAIVGASPVQIVTSPSKIVEGRETVFLVSLSSSHDADQQALVKVDLTDGNTSAHDERVITVKPEGAVVALFTANPDPLDPASQFIPRLLNNDALEYTVRVELSSESGYDPQDCRLGNNELDGRVPIVATKNSQVVYLPWHWDDRLDFGDPREGLPPRSQVEKFALSNDRFRNATFPIKPSTDSVIVGPSLVSEKGGSPVGGLLTALLGLLGIPLDPPLTVLNASLMAKIAGIDRVVLVPRLRFIEEETDMYPVQGFSLGEFAPRAVMAEPLDSDPDAARSAIGEYLGAHELGHTYKLSRRKCSLGGGFGLLEDLLNMGCRDEYNHSEEDGRPYLGHGFDVLGIRTAEPGIISGGSFVGTGEAMIPATGPDSRFVILPNFMDNTEKAWIDSFTHDFLIEELATGGFFSTRRAPASVLPMPVVGLTALIVATGIPGAPGFDFTGEILTGFTFDGEPDLPILQPGETWGSGPFELRVNSADGVRIYRFNPELHETKAGLGMFGGFSSAIPDPGSIISIELVGPEYLAADGDKQVAVFDTLSASAGVPVIQSVFVETGGSQPVSAGSQPLSVPANGTFILSWTGFDPDGDTLVSAALVRPSGGNGPWYPFALPNDVQSQIESAATFFPETGSYDVRLYLSDGINTDSTEISNAFVIEDSQCGDGVVSPSEACDPSAGDSCCTATCTLAVQGTVCRDASGVCNPAEVCDGASAQCPADATVADGSPCSDGKLCTTGDFCSAGVCQPTECQTGVACGACGLAGTCGVGPSGCGCLF
ncbi:MAG: hypothetical protein P8K76_12535 [Candidatus Binatia bacterium]|nr:hypothetical protein [Candidatus Binatia bacterium]